MARLKYAQKLVKILNLKKSKPKKGLLQEQTLKNRWDGDGFNSFVVLQSLVMLLDFSKNTKNYISKTIRSIFSIILYNDYYFYYSCTHHSHILPFIVKSSKNVSIQNIKYDSEL